ncbi:hypothetical protein [Janthinobacterium sp. LB2P10]|uniref:hypothetical protein n=1 Tax=Janthinobacterium sp. LB2P10 TaxID=3424194 RepID=UPI003F29BED2
MQLQQMLTIARWPLPVADCPYASAPPSSSAKVPEIKTAASLLSYTRLRSHERQFCLHVQASKAQQRVQAAG